VAQQKPFTYVKFS